MYENNLEGVLKLRFLDPTPKGSDVGDLWWDLRLFISNGYPGCADATSLGATLGFIALPQIWHFPYLPGSGQLLFTSI